MSSGNSRYKFRAWDGRQMSIFGFAELTYTIDDDGVHFGDCAYTSFNADKIDFMQYTGLKDKNGVEIYEGDIVEYYIKEDQSRCEVIFVADRQARFARRYGDLKSPIQFDDPDCWEVIGNIYENPELLQEEG